MLPVISSCNVNNLQRNDSELVCNETKFTSVKNADHRMSSFSSPERSYHGGFHPRIRDNLNLIASRYNGSAEKDKSSRWETLLGSLNDIRKKLSNIHTHTDSAVKRKFNEVKMANIKNKISAITTENPFIEKGSSAEIFNKVDKDSNAKFSVINTNAEEKLHQQYNDWGVKGRS